MKPYSLLDAFAGIGGMSTGLERTGGFETVAFVENNPDRQLTLAHLWPEVPCYDDIELLTAERLAADGIDVDAISAGFPCQDIGKGLAVHGTRLGTEGERSGLYRHVIRLAGALRPRIIILENVSNLLSGPREQPGAWFGAVLGDLASIGYDAEWDCRSSAGVGRPHGRDRIWIIAYPVGERDQRLVQSIGACEAGSWRESGAPDLFANDPFLPGHSWPEPLIRGMDAGFPAWAHRIAGLGNAVDPAIPEAIGRAILADDARLAAQRAAA